MPVYKPDWGTGDLPDGLVQDLITARANADAEGLAPDAYVAWLPAAQVGPWGEQKARDLKRAITAATDHFVQFRGLAVEGVDGTAMYLITRAEYDALMATRTPSSNGAPVQRVEA